MNDTNKTKKQLIDELVQMRRRVAQLEAAESERRQAEQVWHESEEFLRRLVESAEDIIIMQDLEGRYLYWHAASLYGLSAEDVIGKTPFDFLASETAAGIMERVKQVSEHGESLTVENRRNGGTVSGVVRKQSGSGKPDRLSVSFIERNKPVSRFGHVSPANDDRTDNHLVSKQDGKVGSSSISTQQPVFFTERMGPDCFSGFPVNALE